jgi:PAS domain S-box-containing protein
MTLRGTRAEPQALSQASALLRSLWASPQPATLQGADYRLLDVNDAYASLVGQSRNRLVGRDPLQLQPADDRELNRAERLQVASTVRKGGIPPPLRRRLLDASGQARWFALTVTNIAEANAQPVWLTLLQDHSAGQHTTHESQTQASRAEAELAQWFELSGSGMLVYDDSGLIVRSNAAFEALVERVPEVLMGAAPELQALLGWQGQTMLPELLPGAPAVERQALLQMADGRRRRLWARLACAAESSGKRRVMAVVQDRSAEDERDLAQLEMGMLMDTASIGVATYDPARGWLAPSAAAPSPGPATAEVAASPGTATSANTAAKTSPSGALLGIGRELVEPASLPEFERLQTALRRGERTEVRYAVRHPDLGQRWLLTRVEPGALAGGRNTTSIVTLDVTEQEGAQRRNEQLLHELTTILDSSNAGIAYLRGPVLVRCNRRFERMLGFEAGAAAGASLQEIFTRSQGAAAGMPHAQAAAQALAAGQPYEAELRVDAASSPNPTDNITPAVQWFSLSVRNASLPGEAVAVLTDITRLKLQQSQLEQLLRDRELMFSLSEVGIVYQRGARIERANQAMATLTGWASPELTTLDAAELYENARECVDFEARIARALREQGRFSGERRLRRRDGSLTWVQVAVRPVSSGALAGLGGDAPETAAVVAGDAEAANTTLESGVICSFVDINERRLARESLALQAERTRSVLNSVLVGIVTVSDRGIEWMNRSARRMFGGELADFVGSPISTVATPEPEHPLRRTDWPQRLLARQDSRKQARPDSRPDSRPTQAETFECRLRGRDGREFWVVGNAVLSSTGAGSTAAELAEDASFSTTTQVAAPGHEVTFALLDIEARRQAEVSIAQAQASLQRVIETAPLAIALFDARTLRVQQLNQTASSLFGRPLPQMLGARLEDVCPADMASALNTWLQGVASSRITRQHEWQDITASTYPGGAGAGAGAGAGTSNGDTASHTHRVWDCRIAPLDDGGAPADLQSADTSVVSSQTSTSQLLLVATDVTEQRAAERARLQAAIDQREVLVREVHHRIKNNLQGVAGLLQQNAIRHPEVASVLSEAVGQVQAIAQVYGLQVGASGPLEVAGLLRAIAQSVQRTFGSVITVEVTGTVPHLLPEAEAIPVALTLNELLTNAIKHGQGGDVRCELAVLGPAPDGSLIDGVVVRITGPGTLPAGFDLSRLRGGVSGLGLVRALLPRRSATLSLVQDGATVVAVVELRSPSVRLP